MNMQLEMTFSQRLLATRLLDVEQLRVASAAVDGDESALSAHLVREGLLTRFQARQVRAGATNFHVDKYVVLDCLGRGGNGVVFKARHTLLPGRHVALKTLDTRDLHHGDDMLARFRREIEIVSRLDHPNVVRAHDVVHTRTQLYLVLEYIEGRDLAALVKDAARCPSPRRWTTPFRRPAAWRTRHRCGVVHRDIKPGNLLVTRDNVVKLSDLGLARLYAQDSDELTIKGRCMGTPEFMAPEQAEDASRADARSDLYSLGSTLFHLLTAELPVTGSSQLHRLQRLLTVPPRPLAEARADVPAGLAAVVDRLRSRDPAARPATADEVIALLEPYLLNPSDEPARWDGRRKATLVLDVLQGKATAAEVCLRHRVAPADFEQWRQRFLEGAEQSLDPNAAPKADPATLRDLHAKIGAQAMELEALKKRLNGQ